MMKWLKTITRPIGNKLVSFATKRLNADKPHLIPADIPFPIQKETVYPVELEAFYIVDAYHQSSPPEELIHARLIDFLSKNEDFKKCIVFDQEPRGYSEIRHTARIKLLPISEEVNERNCSAQNLRVC